MEFGNRLEQSNNEKLRVEKGLAPDTLGVVVEKPVEDKTDFVESEEGVKVTKEFLEASSDQLPDLDNNFTVDRVNDFLAPFGSKRDQDNNT
jgi:hypothetical protein